MAATNIRHPTIRAGQGLLLWRVCPATKTYRASFWQGFFPQMYADELWTSSNCWDSPVTTSGRCTLAAMPEWTSEVIDEMQKLAPPLA